jgi:hypothetical protein
MITSVKQLSVLVVTLGNNLSRRMIKFSSGMEYLEWLPGCTFKSGSAFIEELRIFEGKQHHSCISSMAAIFGGSTNKSVAFQ